MFIKERGTVDVDDSPIPRCNFKFFAIIICLLLAIFIASELNISTYANIDDENCFGFTSAYETEDMGITNYIGSIVVPICCCAFFALKKRKKKNDMKIISPPSCRQYSKILNC